MDKELIEYLKEMWRKDNHPKYQKYFEEWINNLTPDQIRGCKFWKYCHDTQALIKKIKRI